MSAGETDRHAGSEELSGEMRRLESELEGVPYLAQRILRCLDIAENDSHSIRGRAARLLASQWDHELSGP